MSAEGTKDKVKLLEGPLTRSQGLEGLQTSSISKNVFVHRYRYPPMCPVLIYGLELEPKEDSDLFGVLFAETASWHKTLVALRCPVLT